MQKTFSFFELVDSWSLNYYGLGWPGRTPIDVCGCAEWGFPPPGTPTSTQYFKNMSLIILCLCLW